MNRFWGILASVGGAECDSTVCLVIALGRRMTWSGVGEERGGRHLEPARRMPTTGLCSQHVNIMTFCLVLGPRTSTRLH